MKTTIPELPIDSFDWLRWRNCSIFDICGIICRTYNLLQSNIKQYAIGYIDGDKLFCRPKQNTVAVMFLINGEFEWCHLLKEEFEELFNEKRS